MVAKAVKNKDDQKALLLMKKSFWILFMLLGIASFIGILFNKEIIWLLFERGAFEGKDTANTALILTMYLIGLLPYGLAKIFSLWLYSHEKQLIAAKISAYALGFNIIFSLLLIMPFGAAGLAFASTLSGFILFHLSIKEFGYNNFFNLIRQK